MAVTTLVSVDELKQYIQIQADNTSFDLNLLSLSGTATSLLETFCRAKFSSQVYTQQFHTRNAKNYVYDLGADYQNDQGIVEDAEVQRFPLKGFPVDTAEDFFVYYDPYRLFPESSKLESTDYYLNEPGNALYILTGTVKTVMGLKVVYTGGYTTAPATIGTAPNDTDYSLISGAPEDLKMACIVQTIFLFNKVQEGNIGVKGRDKHSPEYISNELLLCPEAQAMAVPYKRILTGRR